MPQRALITGITGQVGSYLATHLVDHGYEVYGLVRGSCQDSYERLSACQARLKLITGDVTDQSSLLAAVECARPTEVYHLAAHNSGLHPWHLPVLSSAVTGLGTARLLEAVRQVAPDCRFLQAGSLLIFGSDSTVACDETAPVAPSTPFGAAKAFAHAMVNAYRTDQGMFVASTLAGNHTSPRRGVDCSARRVALAAARLAVGSATEIRVADLSRLREFGYAADLAEAAHRIVTADMPDDYVIGSGELVTLRDWIEHCFGLVEATISWEGRLAEEVGRDGEGRLLVRVEAAAEATESSTYSAPERARRELGWSPSLDWRHLAELMVKADYDRLKREREV